MGEVVGKFIFGIVLSERESGGVGIDVKVMNSGVPDEFVLMKMRAQLKRMEEEYFSNYNRGL